MTGIPKSAKGYVLALALCMFVGMVCDIIAIVGPWWQDDQSTHHVKMTLWKIEVSGELVGAKSVNWPNWCGTNYINDSVWCDRIHGARATTILAAIMAFFTTAALVCCSKSLGWIKIAMFTALVSLAAGVSAVGIGSWYPGKSKLDSPGYGFILLCVGAFCSFISVTTAVVAACCHQSGFSSLDANSSQWGSYRPKPAMPPPMMPAPRPVQMPPMQPMPAPLKPLPIPIGHQGDFGIDRNTGPSMPPLAGPGDFGVAPPSGMMNYGMASTGRVSQQRGSGHDFGIATE